MASKNAVIAEKKFHSTERCDQGARRESCSKDADDSYYSMNHGRRGDCIVFYNEKFISLGKRDSAKEDAKLCKNAFKKLGFEVELHKDVKRQELLNTLEEVRRRDHSKCDALVVVFMSHGGDPKYDDNPSKDNREYLCTSDDSRTPTSALWEPFSPDKCPSLEGKPKLFFIQACRGKERDEGVGLRVSTDSIAVPPQRPPRLPVLADHLVMWASTEGHYAFRTSQYGSEKSVFIHFLTEALLQHGTTLSLVDILLKVSRDMSIQFMSMNSTNEGYHGKKQAATTCSTLIKNIRFPDDRKRFRW